MGVSLNWMKRGSNFPISLCVLPVLLFSRPVFLCLSLLYRVVCRQVDGRGMDETERERERNKKRR